MRNSNLYLAEGYTNRIRKVDIKYLGIDKLDVSDYLFQVYPNPSTGILTIESTIKENNTLEIIDLKGNALINRAFYVTTTIDAEFLTDGIYFVSITNSTAIFKEKIVVNH